MKIKTTTSYESVQWSSNTFPHTRNVDTVARVKTLDYSFPTKVTASTVVVVSGILALTVAWGIHFLVGIICALVLVIPLGLAWQKLWAYWDRELPDALNRRLDDEVKALTKTNTELQRMRALLPEGGGYDVRITEFGRLSHRLLQEVERLPRLGGESKHYFQIVNEVQTKIKSLVDSGQDLIDLIGTKRAENTLESIRYLGIDEYTDHISVEMASRRTRGVAWPAPSRPVPARGGTTSTWKRSLLTWMAWARALADSVPTTSWSSTW
jgi:hypothetical protein